MTISFKAYIPGLGTHNNVAQVFQFPGGEWHLRNIWPFENQKVHWIADVRGADPNDLVKAALLGTHASARGERYTLMLPYLPAARADRGTVLGVDAYAGLARAGRPQAVIGVDPHSPAAHVWYDNLRVVDSVDLVERALLGTYDGVISPDKGALGRATRVADRLGVDLYRAEKQRDFDTGRILSMWLTNPVPKKGRYLVVDDICDGGGTFNFLAETIALPREQLSLWVSHGIFSGNAAALHKSYERIYTTDSHPGAYTGAVRPSTIVPVWPYMFRAMTKGE